MTFQKKWLVSCLVYSSTLETEVICFPETSLHFHCTVWHYIPEDRTLQSIFCYMYLKYIISKSKISQYTMSLTETVLSNLQLMLISSPSYMEQLIPLAKARTESESYSAECITFRR
jgi:hypothetical protein